MASRAIIASGGRVGSPSWRALLRRAVRRSCELGGAALLFGAMIFLALALVSYSQTDPSGSTAAGGEVKNWMGIAGAWAAERALFLFGVVSTLFLPLLYVFARKLWRMAEEQDAGVTPSNQRWWRPVGVLLLAMALLSTVLSLAFTGPGGTLPASPGGLSGLLGAKAVQTLAALLPDAAQGWAIMGAALILLACGAALAGRVFAVDWASLLTLPGSLRRMRPATASDSSAPFVPQIGRAHV